MPASQDDPLQKKKKETKKRHTTAIAAGAFRHSMMDRLGILLPIYFEKDFLLECDVSFRGPVEVNSDYMALFFVFFFHSKKCSCV